MSWLYWGSPLVFKRMDNIELWQGDCHELIKNIPDKSVGFICVDSPYNSTAALYDKSIIDWDFMWKEIERVLIPNRAVALFSAGLYTYKLISTKPEWWRFEIIWVKSKKGNFPNCNNRPLSQHETINIFSPAHTANGSKNKLLYVPQGLQPCHIVRKDNGTRFGHIAGKRPSHKAETVSQFTGYPSDVWNYSNETGIPHPACKPTALLENLIRTFSNEGDLVLDFCMGSGSAGVAAVRSNRKFIGIELDTTYFELGCKRIEEEQNTLRLF